MTPATAAALFAVAVLGLVLLFLVVTTYNAIVALRNRIDKAWANIDVALKQRHDVLPNLVAAVAGSWPSSGTSSRRSPAGAGRLPRRRTRSRPRRRLRTRRAEAVRHLFAVVENYPEVKSAENVLRLQAEIARLEDVIADRRELYNDQVFRYNATIAQVPAVALAGLLGWKPRAFFDAEPAADEAPSVDLHPPGEADPDGRDAAR